MLFFNGNFNEGCRICFVSMFPSLFPDAPDFLWFVCLFTSYLSISGVLKIVLWDN